MDRGESVSASRCACIGVLVPGTLTAASPFERVPLRLHRASLIQAAARKRQGESFQRASLRLHRHGGSHRRRVQSPRAQGESFSASRCALHPVPRTRPPSLASPSARLAALASRSTSGRRAAIAATWRVLQRVPLRLHLRWLTPSMTTCPIRASSSARLAALVSADGHANDGCVVRVLQRDSLRSHHGPGRPPSRRYRKASPSARLAALTSRASDYDRVQAAVEGESFSASRCAYIEGETTRSRNRSCGESFSASRCAYIARRSSATAIRSSRRVLQRVSLRLHRGTGSASRPAMREGESFSASRCAYIRL